MRKNLLIGAGTLAIAGVVGTGLIAGAYQGDPNARAPWFSQERHDAMQNAFENNDYNAWKNLQQERMNARQNWMTSKITEENFPRFSEMHRLMEEGKYDEAGEIREELGLEQGRNGLGRAYGRGHGHCWQDRDDDSQSESNT